MTSYPRRRPRAAFISPGLSLSLSLGLALVLGALAAGCGPQKKFCPQTSNGVCPEPMDASGESIYVNNDGPVEERGSIYIPSDAGTN